MIYNCGEGKLFLLNAFCRGFKILHILHATQQHIARNAALLTAQVSVMTA
jgi:hypothetical protein